MKKSFLTICLVLAATFSFASDWIYKNAQDLTVIGKLFTETPNVFHRIDTDCYGGFSPTEFSQVHMSTGIAIAFKTDSPDIVIKTKYVKVYSSKTSGPLSVRGFDFYINRGGKWIWAASSLAGKEDDANSLLRGAGKEVKECLLYLPLFSELEEVQIGVKPGCMLESMANPFRHRIAIFGSSFTHGTGTSRPGMNYPAQLSRMTGLQFINLGCAGHCKLQPYFAAALADANVDAYVFDAFSNPSPETIEERLSPFIETIQAKNPGKPLIFQKTIYRECRNFSFKKDEQERLKMEAAERMMEVATKKYKDVYYITTTNASDEDHTTSVDGTHPGDYGYRLWAESVAGPITEILAKYGIK